MIKVVRQGDVLWKYDGDVKESLGRIQGETKFEVTVEDFPEGNFSHRWRRYTNAFYGDFLVSD